MLRRLAVFIASSTLTILLFTTITVTAVVMTFTTANVKSWLKDSQVYATIVDDLLKQSQTLNKGEGQKNPLDDPGIQAVAKQTFTPEFLQSTAEQVINGMTPWLEGITPKPIFSIDLTGVKTKFADNIGAYALTRYNELPACQPGQLPDSSDVLTVSCKTPGVNPGPQIQKAVDDLKNSKEFLSDTTITADTFGGKQGTNQKPFYVKLKEVPNYYSLAKIAPTILGAMSVIWLLIVLFLSATHRLGIKRVTFSLYLTSFIFFLEMYGVNFGINKASQEITKAASDNAGLQQTGLALIKAVQADINQVFIVFAVSFLAIALLNTIYLIITRTKVMPSAQEIPTQVSEEASEEEPEEEEEPEVKPASEPVKESEHSKSKHDSRVKPDESQKS